MNVQSVNEDEDFPVFKAGPPIPVRTRSAKVKRKVKSGPLKATTSSSPAGLPLMSGGNDYPQSHSSSVLQAESKVKKYIERVKASDELGRKKRVKPEQMLSLEDLYQVRNPHEAAGLTKSQGESQHVQNRSRTRSALVASSKNDELSINDVQDKLRETLRIVKEKDELINKLRESCHDLAIKCADAENRVDELRFSYGRLPSSASSICIGGNRNNKENVSGEQQHKLVGTNLRKCASDECLHTSGEDFKGIGPVKEVGKQDVQTQVEGSLRQDEHNNETLSEQEVGHWRDEDEILQETCSNWIEKIQNWKTDSNFNLSQDSGGDRDSGFRGSAEIDIDSVRRKQRHSSLPRSRRKCKEHHGEMSLKVPSRLLSAQIPQMSSSSTTITGGIQAIKNPPDQCGGPINPITTSQDVVTEELLEHEQSQQHFWPSFSSSSHSQSHLNQLYQTADNLSGIKAKSLFYEMAEADRNKYSYFQEESCCKHRQHRTRHHHHHQRRLCGAKSLDALYFPQQTSQPSSEELRSLIDSSLDPPESILKTHLNARQRSMEKTVKMLDPLLDDATQIALRVKRKSERLAKMLQDACTFE